MMLAIGMGAILRKKIERLCTGGWILGSLLFAASLTPSLIPRTWLTQGALAGICFVIGYMIGVLLRKLWRYLLETENQPPPRNTIGALVLIPCFAIVAYFLWRTTDWQNSVRSIMGMDQISHTHSLMILLVAVPVIVILFLLGKGIAYVARAATGYVRRYIPPRIATVAGVAFAAVLVWMIATDVLATTAFRAADLSYREFDALLEPERPQPTTSNRTGGPGSLLRWDELGRAGREYIASGPDAEEIRKFGGTDAKDPIRLYVGLRSASDAAARARLALEEMKRAGAFDRAVLVVITPTGTGWVDPSAMDSAEYLTHGDIASVAVQYSYLSSPLSLLAQPDNGSETSRALFREVYRYWSSLPKDSRPKLYLHGLSLGALNSEKSAELLEMIGDPINGALWSGPPFGSRMWRSFTTGRNPGTPEWLPAYRDGRYVRFMNQHGTPVPADAPWGAMRIVYLQHASDAITFFDARDAFRRPGWLNAPRGPDVSPDFEWYPVVTMLQLAVDMVAAGGAPMGFGHVFAPENYFDAWSLVLGTEGWSAEELERLRRHLAIRREAPQKSDQEAPYSNRGG